MIKCFGAVSCMYFLSLTTPMVDLFTLLRKKHYTEFYNRNCGTDLQIHFVLFDVSHRIHTAQDARLGYSNLRVATTQRHSLRQTFLYVPLIKPKKRIPLWSHAVMTAKSTLLCRRLIIRSNLTYLRSYTS